MAASKKPVPWKMIELTQRETRRNERTAVDSAQRSASEDSASFGSVDQRRQRRGEKRRIHRLRQIGLKPGIKCVRLAVSADVCAQRGCR
jgi:hypothetical protein